MKHIYTYLLVLLISFEFSNAFNKNYEFASNSLIITGYVDSTCPNDDGRTLELFVDGSVDLTGWSVVVQNDGNGFNNSIDLTSLGTITDEFIYITNNSSTLNAEFSVTSNVITNALIDSNGDDAFQVLDNMSTVIDQFGVENVDGTNTDWNHLNTFFYRQNGVLSNNGNFDASNWSFGSINSLNGQGLCNSGNPFSNNVPFGSYNVNATTEVQFINNSADPNLNLIDIYVDDNLEVDNLNFREATAFIDLNVGTQIDIDVALSNSSSSADSFYTLTTDLDQDKTYILVANGVQNTSNFDTSVNNPIDFELSITPNARKEAIAVSGNTDILFHHGSTDLPSFDIVETTVPAGTIANNLIYSNFPNYVQIATANYRFDVRSQDGTTFIIKYDAPLSTFGLQNQAVTILASGFLNPSNNQNGEEFGLWLAKPDGGSLLELPFISNCSAETAPFQESFESSEWQIGTGGVLNTNDQIDDCWERLPVNDGNNFTWTVTNNATASTQTGPETGFDDGNYIYSESSAGSLGDEAIFKTPIIDVSNLNIPSLEFYYHMFGNDIGQLKVQAKLVNDFSWTQLFTLVGQQQQNQTDDWIKGVVDLSSLSGDLIEIRFIAERGTGFRGDIAIDALNIKEFTTCPEPTNLTASNITGDTVDLSWDPVSSATNGYNWFIYATGDNPDTSTPVANGSTNPSVTSVSVSGLSLSTTYDAYVEAVCSINDMSILSTVETFTTASCTASNQCDYTFTLTSQFGGGWNGETFDVIQDGIVVATLGSNFTSGNSLDVDVALCQDASVELFWNPGGFFAANVGISITNPFGDEIFNKPPGTGSPNSSVFTFTGNCVPPPCPKPTNLALDIQTLDAITLSWDTVTQATNGYEWQVFNQGDDPLIATPVSTGNASAGDTSVVLTGLSSNTDYEVYLISDCDTDGLSDLSNPLPFTSPCATEIAPWTEDFDSSDWIPGTGFQNGNDEISPCWSRNPENTGSDYFWGTRNNSTSSQNTGPSNDISGNGNYIYTEASLGSLNDLAIITSPRVDLSQLTDPTLFYNIFLFGININSLSVQIKEVNSNSWTTLDTYSGQIQTSSDDSWIEEFSDLSAFAGQTIELRFVAQKGAGLEGDIAVDSVSIVESPTCFLPDNFNVSNISDTSVDLSWDLETTASNGYIYEIYNAGDDPNSSTPVISSSVDDNTNSVNVSGLTPSTSYEAYIQSDCGVEGLSNLSQPSFFTTSSCDISEVCNYTFTLLDTFGDGWNGAEIDVIQDGTVIKTLGPDFGFGNQFVVDLDLCDDSNIELFWTDGGLFSNEVGLTVEDSFGIEIYNLPATANPGTSLTTFLADCDTTDCFAPSNFDVANVSSNSADLTWDTFNNAIGGYDWFVFNAGDNPFITSPLFSGAALSSDNSVILSGLTDDTSYDAYIRSDCGITGVSDLSDPITFTTLCNTFNTPFDENFDSSDWQVGQFPNNSNDQINTCWSRTPENINGEYFWGVGDTGSGFTNTGPEQDLTGGNYLYTITNSGSFGTTANFTSPLVDLSNLTDPSLQFAYFMFGADVNQLEIQIKTLADTNWTSLLSLNGQQQTSSTDNWKIEIIDLAAYSNEIIQIRFIATRGFTSDSEIAIDRFKLDELPSCITPDTFDVNNVTDMSADFTWNDISNATNGYQVDVYLENDDPTTDSPVASSTVGTGVNSTSVNGLTNSTNYKAYVFADCGSIDGLSDLSQPVFFTTEGCQPADQCVYTFELEDSFGDGWNGNTIDVIQDGITIKTIGENFTSGSSFTETVSLCDSANIELFWNGGGQFPFEISLTLFDPFNQEIYNKPQGVGSQNTTLFTFTSNCTPPPCDVPANLSVSNIQQTVVDLSWDEVTLATSGYNWSIFFAGDNPQTATAVVSGSVASGVTLVNVSGLLADTDYEAYIQADCDFDQSTLSNALPFTTLDVCEIPNNLTVNNIEQTTVDLSWDEVTDATDGYNWLVFGAGDDPQTGTPIDSGSTVFGTTSVSVSGLSANTDYEAYIQADCNFDQSDLSIAVPFTTLDVCDVPSNLAVNNIEQSTAELTWDEVFDASLGYSWFVFVAGDDPQTDIAVASGTEEFGTTTVNVTGLSANTNYEAYVQADCNFDLSDLSIAVPFTTLDVCEVPSNLAVNIIEQTTADLSWDEVTDATDGYNWFVFGAGDDPQTGTPIDSGSTAFGTTSTSVSGLSANTDYEAYVQADCNFDQSNLSNPIGFTTLDLVSPINETVCNSINLIIGEPSNANEFNNVNAIIENNEPIPSCFANGINSTVWFDFVAPSSGSVNITTDFVGSNLTDTEFAVYQNSSTCDDFNSFVEIACATDGGTINIENADLDLDNLNPGETYYIQVDNGINSTSGDFGIEVNTTLSNVAFDKSNFNYYPNPVESILNIDSANPIDFVQVFDILGKEVINQDFDNQDISINFSGLSSGTYLMKVDISGSSQTFRVIKE